MRFDLLPDIKSISDMLLDPVWASKFHQNMHNEIIHIIKGKLELTYEDGSKHIAGRGETLLNRKNARHKDVFHQDDELEIFFISFDWSHAEIFLKSISSPLIKLSGDTDIEVKKIFDSLRLDTGTDEMDLNVANSRLMNILMLIYRDASCNTQSSKNDGNSRNKQKQLVLQAKKYINRFYSNPLHLEDVAEHLKVSPFYLSRIFSRESDFSLIEYLTERRLEEAKKLLSGGRYIVADVAKMVGYEDSNYFSKVFKRNTGKSPCKYK